MIIYTLASDEDDVEGVDIIELRPDRTSLKSHKKPYLLTNLPPEEKANYIDISYPDPIDSIRKKFKNLKIVYSFHGAFNGVEKTFELIENMFLSAPDLVKCVFDSISVSDYLKLSDLFLKYPDRLILFAQGERGQFSRLLSYVLGAKWIYTSKDGFRGQICLEDLLNLYHIKRLTANTQIYALVKGVTSPPSIGYKIYNDYFFKNQIAALYLNLIIDSTELESVLHSKVFRGFSVTMPFKEEACRHVSQKSSFVKESLSLNTVKGEWGFNTDIEILKNCGLEGKKIAILGGGGVAKAYACFLKDLADVTLFVRNPDKVEKFAKRFGLKIEKILDVIQSFDVLIDTLPSIGVIKYFDPSMTIIDVKLFCDPRYSKASRFISGKDVFIAQGEKQMSIFLEREVDLSSYVNKIDTMIH